MHSSIEFACIPRWACINNGVTTSGSAPAVLLHQQGSDGSPEGFYRQLNRNYPKFFKMDALCKWAWLGAEMVLADGDGFVHDGLDKTRIGVILATTHGCLEVDKKYQESATTAIASPALFVYTLPNIMLGEISIRHGFKGEQLCLVQDSFNAEEIYFCADNLLQRGHDACLCGYVDATSEGHAVSLFWVTKTSTITTHPRFSPEVLNRLRQS